MIEKIFPEEFISYLKNHFHFSNFRKEDQYFVSEHGEVPVHEKIKIEGNNDNYHVFALDSPFILYIIDKHDEFSSHFSMDLQKSRMIHIPNTRQPSVLHRHTHLELVYILRGTLDMLIEGTHIRFHQGEVCLINTNVRHVEESAFDYTAVYLDISESYLNSLIDNYTKGIGDYIEFLPILPLTPPDLASDAVSQTFYQISFELLMQKPCFQSVINTLIQRLFFQLQSHELFTSSHLFFSKKTDTTLTEHIFFYLQTHPYKLTHTELANALGYSASYLNHYFTNQTGKSLSDYNRQIYLKEAANLLLNSDLSVSDIALKLHFESRSAFYEQFRKKYGMTPMDYRNNKSTAAVK